MSPHLNKRQLIQSFPGLASFISSCFQLKEFKKLDDLIMALEVKKRVKYD